MKSLSIYKAADPPAKRSPRRSREIDTRRIAAEVRDRILDWPETYDQEVWVDVGGDDLIPQNSVVEDWAKCGATACVAGHISTVVNRDRPDMVRKKTSASGPLKTAEAVMGLNPENNGKLPWIFKPGRSLTEVLAWLDRVAAGENPHAASKDVKQGRIENSGWSKRSSGLRVLIVDGLEIGRVIATSHSFKAVYTAAGEPFPPAVYFDRKGAAKRHIERTHEWYTGQVGQLANVMQERRQDTAPRAGALPAPRHAVPPPRQEEKDLTAVLRAQKGYSSSGGSQT